VDCHWCTSIHFQAQSLALGLLARLSPAVEAHGTPGVLGRARTGGTAGTWRRGPYRPPPEPQHLLLVGGARRCCSPGRTVWCGSYMLQLSSNFGATTSHVLKYFDPIVPESTLASVPFELEQAVGGGILGLPARGAWGSPHQNKHLTVRFLAWSWVFMKERNSLRCAVRASTGCLHRTQYQAPESRIAMSGFVRYRGKVVETVQKWVPRVPHPNSHS